MTVFRQWKWSVAWPGPTFFPQTSPGFPNLSPYKLRHTFATIARYVGKPGIVDKMMGHGESRVSAIYDHTAENFADWHFAQVRRVAIKVKRVRWPRPQSKRE
jgi:integrase